MEAMIYLLGCLAGFAVGLTGSNLYRLYKDRKTTVTKEQDERRIGF